MIDREGPGRLITICSTSGLVGIPGQAHYQSAKHGIVGQVKTLALELAPYDVTVNAICPTVVESPMLDHLMEVGQAYFQEVARLCGSSTVFPGIDFLRAPRRHPRRPVGRLRRGALRDRHRLAVDGGFTCK